MADTTVSDGPKVEFPPQPGVSAEWSCIEGIGVATQETRCAHVSCNALLINQQFVVEHTQAVNYPGYVINFPPPAPIVEFTSKAQNQKPLRCLMTNCVSTFTNVHARREHLIALHGVTEIFADQVESVMTGDGSSEARNKLLIAGGSQMPITKRRSKFDFVEVLTENQTVRYECQFDDCGVTKSTKNGIRSHILEIHR